MPESVSLLRCIYALCITCLITLFAGNNSNAANICAIPDGQSGLGGSGIIANPSDNGSGIGGTGFPMANNSNRSSGIGGTGFPMANNSNRGSGIGGTGFPMTNNSNRGSGIGGTGQQAGVVMGTITGFGSICVNGVEIHYSAATPLHNDGQTASVDKLAIGQVVAVNVKGTGPEVNANQIHIVHAVTGPVSSIDFANGKMTVLGQTVNLTLNPSISKPSGLQKGSLVAVSGLRDNNGQIIASRIDSLAPTHAVSVRGKITHIAEDQFTVQGTPILAPLPGNIPADSIVSVTGQLAGNAIKPEKITLAEEQRLSVEKGGLISVEQYYAPTQANSSVEIAGKEIPLPDSIRSKLKQLDQPHKIIITGLFEADRRIQPKDLILIPLRSEHGTSEDSLKRNKYHEPHDAENTYPDMNNQYGDTREEHSESAEYRHHGNTEKPEYSEYEKPERMKFERPELPEFEKPERMEFERPELPEFEKPERMEFERPELPEFEKPERMEFERPEHS